MLQLSTIIHDKKTTRLPTPEFDIKKKKKKFKKKKKKKKKTILQLTRAYMMCIFSKNYFCQLIFATIHGSHCIF